MILRFSTAALVLALMLMTSTGSAQSAAEQMQKAIYHQQTDGDLDAAIQGYRQIINSSPADRKVAAMAQFRLAQALLQKGELQEAAREFQALTAKLSEPTWVDVSPASWVVVRLLTTVVVRLPIWAAVRAPACVVVRVVSSVVVSAPIEVEVSAATWVAVRV